MSRPATKAVDRETLHVSARDQQIYHQVVIEGLKQTDVAREHGLSPARISRIVHRVLCWLSQAAPPGLKELPPEQQLTAAGRTYQLKLKYFESLAERAYTESATRDTATQIFDILPGEDGEGVVRAKKGKLYVRSAKADFRYLVAAEIFARKQAEFAGLTSDGDDGPQAMSDVELDERIRLGKHAEDLKLRMKLAARRHAELVEPGRRLAETADTEAEGAERAAEVSNTEAEISNPESETSNFMLETSALNSVNQSPAAFSEHPPAGLAISATPKVGLDRENVDENGFVNRAISGAATGPFQLSPASTETSVQRTVY